MKRNCNNCRQKDIASTTKTPAIHACQQSLFEVGPITPITNQKQKTESSYVFDIVDALSAPILTFSDQWADTIPKRMVDIITPARLKALIQREEFATYPECVVYIYTRSLDAPMDSEWTDIYTHLTCKTLEEWFNEHHWDEVKAPKQLSDWLVSKLHSLRLHIYNKRREILKKEFRGQEQAENKLTKTATKETSSKQPKLSFS